MNKIRKIPYTLATLLLLSISISAQGVPAESDMMRSHGKIYVVMAVVLTIITGLFIYIALLDKKISKLEKKN